MSTETLKELQDVTDVYRHVSDILMYQSHQPFSCMEQFESVWRCLEQGSNRTKNFNKMKKQLVEAIKDHPDASESNRQILDVIYHKFHLPKRASSKS